MSVYSSARRKDKCAEKIELKERFRNQPGQDREGGEGFEEAVSSRFPLRKPNFSNLQVLISKCPTSNYLLQWIEAVSDIPNPVLRFVTRQGWASGDQGPFLTRHLENPGDTIQFFVVSSL